MSATNASVVIMTNPLLSPFELPPFAVIRPEHVEPAIRERLEQNRAELVRILESKTATWDSVVAPLETMQHRLARTWSPVSHLNGVMNSDELRVAYNACLPLLTAWHTELGQNGKLYAAYETVLKNEGAKLLAAQRKLLENALRDFRLAGVALPTDKKVRFKTVMEQLASLHAKFDENVLDATNAWSRHIENESELAGLPAPIVARAKAEAETIQKSGWFFSLDAPNYQAVMMHAEHEPLRREFYEAWNTRASDQGPYAGKWDNSQLMEQILALRFELANLVGFPTYAEYSLATKMAKSVKEVSEFLQQLADVAKPAAQREFDELTKLAGRTLNAWDVGFYGERLKRQRFNLSEEALRPYFPAPVVLKGMFAVAEKLYNVRIVERQGVEFYHDDVRFFDILNTDGTRRGSFFIDLYARPKKRGGAWMDECVGRMQMTSGKHLPVAYLVCNFMPPSKDKPSLLTHSEVVTTFHEFGHGLHHMLTRVDFPSVAGINGVPWDAVELPSQFMENFAWREEVLPLISAHVDTGAPLPVEELKRLQGSRSFQAGMQTVRQLEFALFDLRMHAEYAPNKTNHIAATLADVRNRVAVVKPPAFNRFPQSFSHIFSGGYAAGYYSYKWAEVLAADAFSAFEEQGVFNNAVAKKFLNSILEKGGSRDAMEAFVEFRGRKPKIEPLLKQMGLAA
ncbi:MAG TPA: M3 family metallopeptidase [Steroidobacteraceae bacterium]|nr:M3 family metallopeptidase [Steroidobacteraceae bacterium]